MPRSQTATQFVRLAFAVVLLFFAGVNLPAQNLSNANYDTAVYYTLLGSAPDWSGWIYWY